MRIRWLLRIVGTVEGQNDGVFIGDVMEVPDHAAVRYIRNGYAEEVHSKSAPVDAELPEEHAVAPEPETAVVDETEEEHAVAPEPEKAVARPARQQRSIRK